MKTYKILANDGIDAVAKSILEREGFEVDTTHYKPEEFARQLPLVDAITVRSATQITKELIDLAPRLSLIGRGGVGMDNIDVAYALSKGIKVINTPAASSLSVAELVFAHLFSGIRFLYDANRKMPIEGNTRFAALKKAYSQGTELRGKKMGIVGFGRIGQEVGRIALGLGMDVLAFDLYAVPETLKVKFTHGIEVDLPVRKVEFDILLAEADFISFHVPHTQAPILGKAEFNKLKASVGLINTSRGSAIDEDELLLALNDGRVGFAGLDVFNNEPTPKNELLIHPKISLSPHIGAATGEAQERIGVELADQIIAHFRQVEETL